MHTYVTSYWSSIATSVLACCVSEILELLYAESKSEHCENGYYGYRYYGDWGAYRKLPPTLVHTRVWNTMTMADYILSRQSVFMVGTADAAAAIASALLTHSTYHTFTTNPLVLPCISYTHTSASTQLF